MKKEEAIKKIDGLFKDQNFDPLWKFIISPINKIVDEYYKNSEIRCVVTITDEECELFNLSLMSSIASVREILNVAGINATLIFLTGKDLNIHFSR